MMFVERRDTLSNVSHKEGSITFAYHIPIAKPTYEPIETPQKNINITNY
jgi:hypothetical protein